MPFEQQQLNFGAPDPAEAEEDIVVDEFEDEEEDLEDSSAPSYYTVSQLTRHLEAVIEEDPVLGDTVVVRGELSNVKRSSRGHVYFTLKDEGAGMSGIIWAGLHKNLSFKLEDGLDVFLTGNIEIYAPNGTYSIVARRIEPVGIGSLQLAFQQIKEKLETEGLFRAEFKKPLPPFPDKVGIVTSRTGAVIHDMLRVIRRKNPYVNVLVAPVKVQGPGSAEEIAAAIRELNRPEYDLDVLIVGRGGGSFEDLFCFSEEPVVRAVFQSRVPIVTGIGHEPDFALADAAADYSASTPTAAAEAAVPDFAQIVADVGYYREQLQTTLGHTLMRYEQQFDQLATGFLDRTDQMLALFGSQLSLVEERLTGEVHRRLDAAERDLEQAAAELEAFSPLATMSRGYTVAELPDGRVARQTTDLMPGNRFQLRLLDGKRHCEVLDDDTT